ncbi:MAG: AAA family ATPase [Candidatus Accumulibacter sp.]|uniref:AAA family ATPase n=1 Tax=Accumulibacter sp. TaxID=2053492 RepID=UPI001AD0C25A|nr:AAA family ATPase [Accumulibacter sp.]MBN8438167.1 AAA family ATPase [Accumulibacter sp.]
MAITKVSISNFKGIGGKTQFEIRPITIFLGANSSGKSSAIHALMSLAQTLKLGNGAPSLVLDDEFAHVHLGRFIEIAHSHSYSDPIRIGIEISERKFRNTQKATLVGPVTANYSFKSTLRTQEVYVDEADITISDTSYLVSRAKKRPYDFSATDLKTGYKFDANRRANFLFQFGPMVGQPTKGDEAEWFGRYWLFEAIQREVEMELREIRYLGPFRQTPLRRYPIRSATATEVGPQGDATITLLATEHVQARDKQHARQINKWLTELGLAKTVELSRVGTSDLFDVSLTLADGAKLPIADLGYGLSQVLPVLTQCSFASKGSTLLFEQPELHLHENAARKLAKVFVDTAVAKGANIVLETHSKELIYDVMSQVKAGTLSVNDLAIYKVRREAGASTYTKVPIVIEDGSVEVLEDWSKTLTHD